MSHEKGIEAARVALERCASFNHNLDSSVDVASAVIAAYLAEAQPTSEGAVANQTLTDAQLQDLANIAPVTLAVNGNPRYAITSRHLVYEIQGLRETERKYERLVRVVGGDLDEALERIEQPTSEATKRCEWEHLVDGIVVTTCDLPAVLCECHGGHDACAMDRMHLQAKIAELTKPTIEREREAFQKWAHPHHAQEGNPMTSRDRRVVSDFLRGLTIVGLARKYGRTVKQIEDVLRKALWANPASSTRPRAPTRCSSGIT